MPKPRTPLLAKEALRPVAGFWCRVEGLGFRVLGFRVYGPETEAALNL